MWNRFTSVQFYAQSGFPINFGSDCKLIPKTFISNFIYLFICMARASVVITKYCSQSVTGSLIGMDLVCFFYLVIWDDDSEMIMMRTKEKRWHCVIRWLSNRKRVWTTTEIFVKNLQSLLSISVIWHAMLSFMGIQYRLPEIS